MSVVTMARFQAVILLNTAEAAEPTSRLSATPHEHMTQLPSNKIKSFAFGSIGRRQTKVPRRHRGLEAARTGGHLCGLKYVWSKAWLLREDGILGNVKHHVLRFEVQHRHRGNSST